MECKPKECGQILERISIKAESGVEGDIIARSILEECKECPFRGRKTAREIGEELGK